MRNIQHYRALAAAGLAALILLAMAATSAAGPMVIARISTPSSGAQVTYGVLGSYYSSISNDGRYVAFDSDARDLWPAAADNYGFSDVFKKDTQTGVTTPVSFNMNMNGEPGNGNSFFPSISQDGQYIVFESAASDLVPGDANGVDDIFIQDTLSGITGRVTEIGGVEADGASYNPKISADGNFVVFESTATNLVAGDTNARSDIFVRDLPHNTISRVSVASAGGQSDADSYNPDIDAYGRYVVFESTATNLVAGDTNGVSDVFIRDRTGSTTVRLSVSATNPGAENGASIAPAISPDASNSLEGVVVAFESTATNMVYGDGNAAQDVFTRKVSRADLTSGTTSRVSVSAAGAEANGDSFGADIADSGRFVAFSSLGSVLVGGDTNSAQDVFVKDTVTGAVKRASVSASGVQTASGASGNASLDAGGRYATFSSAATNLVPGDTNAFSDVFMTRTGAGNAFTWYDNQYSSDWILLANPASAAGDAWFDLAVAGTLRDLSPFSLSGAGCPGGGSCEAGQVPAGRIIYPRIDGLIGGPVDIGYHAWGGAFSSQRILWPSGGGARDSLEEVLGTDSRKLSDHFFWTWYDQYWPGMTNWVLVANPNPYNVYYRISIGGAPVDSGSIAPGANTTPTFAGQIGGPVEVQAWADQVGGAMPANVMASQRVLSNFGNAFNEVPGIPQSELSDHYLWTWYDQQSAGAKDWILIANPPGDAAAAVYYKIWIDGSERNDGSEPAGSTCKGPLADNANRTPQFAGVIGGPVEVRTFSDAACTVPADSIASQRVIWGPSFEEVPGLPYAGLSPSYHWTWYDESAAGVRNWVLVANPSQTDTVKVEIWMNGVRMHEDNDPLKPDVWTLAPGQRVTPTFGAYIGGPVEVRAYLSSGSWNGNGGADNRPVMASQRVLWNGFFNEVLGTVVD